MSPYHKSKPAPRTPVRATLLLAVGVALAFLAFPVSAASNQVTICHATGSESNPFVSVTASKAGVVSGHYGADHQDGDDIIPPFTFHEVEYQQNWDTAGQAIFNDGCDVDDPECEQDCGSETETETSGSETETETEEVPFFGAGPSTVALGSLGALGGALLMLRRRL